MGTVTVKWIESTFMNGIDSNGRPLNIGWSRQRQPEWTGVKPSDLLLLAAASCSTYDVVDILTKQREPLDDLEVICTGEQLPEPPYTFTCIHLHYKVKGAVNPNKLTRAIQLSEEKYCSVINTLKPTVRITSSSEIVE
ncbi:MAG: OsmC family peroxiredoxin [Anaerolineae bacterium]|nr:OsmC family protein [Anaerolineales bacterium]MCQ3973592.1 OsmC family peroxiredoxin [Anaerolineae bacterium]